MRADWSACLRADSCVRVVLRSAGGRAEQDVCDCVNVSIVFVFFAVLLLLLLLRWVCDLSGCS